jgi:lipoprotein-releasing system ATP-binding protein
MGAFLKLEKISKTFEAAPGAAPVSVLRDISLEIEQGQSAAIVGPSGSGKSTLLNIIGGLERPTSGRVLVEGVEVATFDENALADFRNRRLGFIFQAHHLLPQCSALENALIPTLVFPKGAARAEAPERARRLLTRVGLGARLDHRPGQLSGGERQRVAVVRALINRPGLLLADEPTGALDRAAAEALARLLLELNREEKVTLLVVTHAADLAAQMQRAFELQDGQLVSSS